MKTGKKKTVSILLTFIMVFSIFTFMPSEVSAATPLGYWTDGSNIATSYSDKDNTNSILTIKTAGELARFANEMQNDSGNKYTLYDGWTVKLGDDIDLSAHYWFPGILGDTIFDGQGYTISGLNVESVYTYYFEDNIENPWFHFGDSSEYGCYIVGRGLFAWIDRGTVQNLKLEAPILHSPYYSILDCSGPVAGFIKGGRIRDVVVNDPDIEIACASGTTYAGGVVGFAYETDVLKPGKQPLSVVSGAVVNNGNIYTQAFDSSIDDSAIGSVAYLGGVVGANYKSLVGSCLVNGTQISSDKTVDYYISNDTIFGFYAGGIAGYTSMEDAPPIGTCLLNNFSMPKFDIDPALKATNKHIGGIAGLVKNDDIVNNLYIGNEDMFGKVDNSSRYTCDGNYSFASPVAAWNSGIGNGALYKHLNGSGFMAAATALNDHRGGNIKDALTRLRVWEVDASTKVPYFGKYYSSDTLPRSAVAATPKATPSKNTSGTIKVKLTCSTPGAKIFYTLDKKNPTIGSKWVNSGEAVSIKKNSTLKFMSTALYHEDSAVVSKNYKVKTVAPNKKAVPKSKAVKKGSKIKLKAPAGTTLYYTTNGKAPTTKIKTKVSPGKTKKITIKKKTTLKVIAVKKGCEKSSVIKRTYKLK